MSGDVVPQFSDVVIHIGYHKAASTLLQRNLFTAARGFGSPWTQGFYHRAIMLDRPDKGWAARVREAFSPGIEEARLRGLVPVLTCEALSGDMWRIGQANGFANFHVADVLADAFPGARVIIVHREQISMITSLYKHSVRSHWATTVRNFLDQTPREDGMAPLLNLGYLEYSWLLEHYQQLFGSRAVLALPFELLVADPVAWSQRLASFTERPVEPKWFAAPENRAMSAAVVRVKARMNMLIPQTANPDATLTARLVSTFAHELDDVLPRRLASRNESKLRTEVAALVGDRFAPDNRRLFGLTGEPWTVFGYATSSDFSEPD